MNGALQLVMFGLLGVSLLSCSERCRGGNEVFVFFSESHEGLDEFRRISIVSTGIKHVVEEREEIAEFANGMFSGSSKYLDQDPRENHTSERTEIGKIVFDKDSSSSCYILYESRSVPELFAIRVNNPAKGGGTIMWFYGFKVSGKEVF